MFFVFVFFKKQRKKEKSEKTPSAKNSTFATESRPIYQRWLRDGQRRLKMQRNNQPETISEYYQRLLGEKTEREREKKRLKFVNRCTFYYL